MVRRRIDRCKMLGTGPTSREELVVCEVAVERCGLSARAGRILGR